MIEARGIFLYSAGNLPRPNAMQKPLALSLALCLTLTGCQVFEKSKTWDTVVSVRPGETIRDADPSAAYAEKLHAVLLEQGVEHCVVTYQYHYHTSHYEEAVGTRTAIVYRDETNGSYPWWLKDDHTATPFWLPNGDLDAQLSFYCQRKAEVIEKKHYPARNGGKEVVAPRHTAQNQLQFRGGIAPSSQPKSRVAERSTLTKILHFIPIVEARKKPLPEVAVSPNADPTARDENLEKLFRTRNGTSYDPTSAVDRRKMEQLKHGLLGQDTTGEQGIRRGVDGGGHSQF